MLINMLILFSSPIIVKEHLVFTLYSTCMIRYPIRPVALPTKKVLRGQLQGDNHCIAQIED